MTPNISPSPRPLQPDGRVHGVVIACPEPGRGACRRNNKWLCIRRSEKVISPLKVCFPGGAIEVGESQPAAVQREMLEELGVNVTPQKNVWRWDRPNSNLTLWGWLADLLPGDIRPDPLEVAEVLWLTGEEVANHIDALPSNRLFVESLERMLNAEC